VATIGLALAELGVDLAVGELAGHPEAEQPEGDQGGDPHEDRDAEQPPHDEKRKPDHRPPSWQVSHQQHQKRRAGAKPVTRQ
jgi:hypothetical protein